MPKKIPMRQCMGCREMKQKRELIRVVRSPDGVISLDLKGGKSPGRGAYLCPVPDCFKKARKSRSIERVLNTAISSEIYDMLLEKVGAGDG